MIFSAYFSESGLPKASLVPKITVYNVTDGTTPVAAQDMTEIGNGWYKYDYAAGDETDSFAYLCDSVTLTGSERYAAGDWTPFASEAMEYEVESGVKAKHILAAALAYMVNKRSGGGTATLKYRNANDDLDRITQTVNDKGEVSSAILDTSDIP